MSTFTTTSKENSRRIRAEIHNVFINIWDPIGVRDEPNAQDEYDGYIGRMLEFLLSHASDSDLKQYLDWCVERMGMNSSHHSDADVIQALHVIALTQQEN